MTALLLYALLQPQNPSAWRPVEITVYDARYDGHGTASGTVYRHKTCRTAATTSRGAYNRPQAPFGSVWEVRYKGRTVRVTITDTGSRRPRGAAIWLDLSGRAWRELTSGAKPTRFIAFARRRR